MECRGRAGRIRLVAIARTYELLVVCFSFGLCVVLAFEISRFTGIPGLRTGLDWTGEYWRAKGYFGVFV